MYWLVVISRRSFSSVTRLCRAMSIWAHRFFLSAMVCAPFLVLQRKYIQNHGRKLLPRPPSNQGQSKQYHQLKQPRNTKREAPPWPFDLNCQRGLLSLFSLCSEVRITPHHENGLLHLHLVWCSILSSETAETLAAARVSGVTPFSATLVVRWLQFGYFPF